jgi:hypothetical protein
MCSHDGTAEWLCPLPPSDRAIERCGWPRTRLASRELPNQDALQLVKLYGVRGSPKYEKAAMRCLERCLTEGSPRLQHFAEITASLATNGLDLSDSNRGENRSVVSRGYVVFLLAVLFLASGCNEESKQRSYAAFIACAEIAGFQALGDDTTGHLLPSWLEHIANLKSPQRNDVIVMFVTEEEALARAKQRARTAITAAGGLPREATTDFDPPVGVSGSGRAVLQQEKPRATRVPLTRKPPALDGESADERGRAPRSRRVTVPTRAR